MNKKCLVIILTLLVLFTGVSCTNEMKVSECSLKALGKGLEVPGVTYQYYVEKNGGPKAGKICDWTNFDINSGFVIKNLLQGNYTFTVRGITSQGALVSSGSTSCYLTSGSQNNITIVLDYYMNETGDNSSITVTLPISASGNITSSAVCKNRKTGKTKVVSLSVNNSVFSSTIPLSPGYYDLSVFVYREGVAVGGSFDVVFVPNGVNIQHKVTITPRTFSNMYDIKNTPVLNLKKGDVATLAWVGEVGSDGNGYWFQTDRIVDSNSAFYTLPTSKAGSYTVEYHRGSTKKTCVVTVTEPVRVYEHIMNFRSAENGSPCIGYHYSNNPSKKFPLTREDVTDVAGYIPGDYKSLGLVADHGTLDQSDFAEVLSFDTLTYKNVYGSNTSIKNTCLKILVVGANQSGYAQSNIMNGKFSVLEKMLIHDVSAIQQNAITNLPELTTLYIIPNGKVTIYGNAFYGCSKLSKIYFMGDSTQLEKKSNWNNGTKLQDGSIEFITDGTQPW